MFINKEGQQVFNDALGSERNLGLQFWSSDLFFFLFLFFIWSSDLIQAKTTACLSTFLISFGSQNFSVGVDVIEQFYLMVSLPALSSRLDDQVHPGLSTVYNILTL